MSVDQQLGSGAASVSVETASSSASSDVGGAGAAPSTPTEGANNAVDVSPVSNTIESAEPKPSEPSDLEYLSQFAWEEWDGKDYSKLGDKAEKYKPVFEKIGSFRSKLETQFSEQYEKRAEELRDYYVSVIQGKTQIDPGEFKKMSEAVDALRAEAQAAMAKASTIEAEYETFRNQVARREEQRYTNWVTNFKERNADLWKDEGRTLTFKAALENGFPINEAVTLARGDAKIAARAIELAKEKVPPAKALEFAKMEAVKAAPENKAAGLVEGANRAAPTSIETTVDVRNVPVTKRVGVALDQVLSKYNLS